MTAGETHPAVEKTREAYTVRLLYQDADANTVSTGAHKFNTLPGYTSGSAALLSAVPVTTAHGGTAVHDVDNDSFSVTFKCHDPNGEGSGKGGNPGAITNISEVNKNEIKKCRLFFALELNVVPHVFGSPVTELVEDRNEGLCCFRERILHFRRNLWVHLSDDKAIFLQFAELFCQHPLGNPGLDIKIRELLTFSMLLALGGCEPQLKGHIRGNLNVGNDKETLLSVVTQLLPYVGYPRTLNALRCLNEVIPE